MSLLDNFAANVAVFSRLVQDSWQNSNTGMGQSALDKTVAGRFVASTPFTAQYLADLFNGDALAARMCEHEPKEMLRQGFEITPGDEQDAAAASDVLTAVLGLGAPVELQRGLTWEDLFGGGVVLIGCDDGETDPRRPLNEQNLRRITSLKAFEGSQMWPVSWYPATSPKAGQVEVWGIVSPGGAMPMVNGRMTGAYSAGMAQVHESRMLVFAGGLVTTEQRLRNNGWGRSILAAVHDPLMDYNMSWRGVTHMLQSANQDVWYFAGLKKALSDSTGAMLEYFRGRFQLSQMKMGPNRGITMDADGNEKFERHGSQFAGVPDTIEQQAMRLATARGWPVTILLGRSPAGMNATGESDMDTWYNLVAADRTQRLDPQLKRLITLVMLSKDGPTGGKLLEGWGLHWPSFEQMSDKEQAELELAVAQRDQIYLNGQVLRPEEVAVSRFRREGFSAATVIDLDARQAALDSDAVDAPASDPGTKGAQMDALLKVQTQVATGQIPREAGVANLMLVFQIEEPDADALMGDIGTPRFTPTPVVDPNAPVPTEPGNEPKPVPAAFKKQQQKLQGAPDDEGE